MGIRSTLSAILSAPLAAALESKVRQAAEDALRERDLADPAEIRRLAAQVDQARRAVDALKADVSTCQDAIRALQDDEDAPSDTDALLLQVAGLGARDEELAEAIDRATQRVDTLGDQLVTLRKSLATADGRATAAQELATKAGASAATTKATLAPAPKADRGCQVEGCDGNHRARGFCGRHYQLWKRANLPGFVNADGTVSFADDGPSYATDKAHAGKAATLKGKRIHTGGATFELSPV